MDYPEVTVEEVTGSENIRQTPSVNLGDRPSAQRTARHLERVMGQTRINARVFLLTWEGSKIPRGAKVLDHVISWTQNGSVSDSNGRIIGTYDRLVEFGGQSGQQQQMRVYLWEKT